MIERRFVYLGREWIGRWVVNEADTKLLPRITPAQPGPPWPPHEEYRGAQTQFRLLTEHND